MKLSDDQENAAKMFGLFLLDDDINELVIEGRSGSGKSTLTEHLINVARKQASMLQLLTNEKNQIAVHCTATTNKAARVLSEKANEPSQTIHSFLGLKVENNFRTGKTYLKKTKDYKKYKDTLIIIDEASMVNSDLLKEIREATNTCKVVYIGDPYQLAPVKETTCPVFDSVKHKAILTMIMRQGKGSPIAALGDKFRETVETGEFPDIEPFIDNKEIIRVTGPEFQHMVNNTFTKGMCENKAKIVAWTNNQVQSYNGYVRSLFTTSEEFEVGEIVVTNKPIMGTGWVLTTDELVEITDIVDGNNFGLETWNYELNGNINVHQAKEPWRVEARIKALAKEKDWGSYFAMKEAFVDLRATYASTIHKCQGSTYEKVFIDLTDVGACRKWQDVARMLYVAITRASSQVVLYGELPEKYRGTPELRF